MNITYSNFLLISICMKYLFFHTFTFSLYVSLGLKWITCRQNMCVIYLYIFFGIPSIIPCVLVGAFNSFAFKVIVFSFFIYFILFYFLLFFLFVVNFVKHWNETAMGLHVFPIPIPPPTSLSTRSLWVFPVHQVRALVSCIQPGLVICFTLDNIHVSMLFSWTIPPSPSSTESKRLFYKSVSFFSVLHIGLSLTSFYSPYICVSIL